MVGERLGLGPQGPFQSHAKLPLTMGGLCRPPDARDNSDSRVFPGPSPNACEANLGRLRKALLTRQQGFVGGQGIPA